jgi:hypothetical protein
MTLHALPSPVTSSLGDCAGVCRRGITQKSQMPFRLVFHLRAACRRGLGFVANMSPRLLVSLDEMGWERPRLLVLVARAHTILM